VDIDRSKTDRNSLWFWDRVIVNSTVRGIVYVSVWVLIWGTVASLMDSMLLIGDVYETGSSGQAVTFLAYAAATVVLATRFSSRFLTASGSEAIAPDAEDSETADQK
jgi:membrane protein implicated in regulation of membrane protease activity